MSVSGLNEDFVDILRALGGNGVEFMVVGAHAMAVHGVPRATGDLDILVRPTLENARRVLRALRLFGAPSSGWWRFAMRGGALGGPERSRQA